MDDIDDLDDGCRYSDRDIYPRLPPAAAFSCFWFYNGKIRMKEISAST